METNVEKILHFYDPVAKNFLKLSKILKEHGDGLREMMYLSIRAAIPKTWKQAMKYDEFEVEIDLPTTCEVFNQSNKPSKKIYWCIIKKLFPVNDTKEALRSLWSSEIGIIGKEQWEKIFTEFMKNVKPIKLDTFNTVY